MSTNQGILIAIEGIDGAGKTTQVERLCRALTEAGETVVRSKEPTDGFYGRKLRESALHGRMSPTEELETFIQDRREHVREVIQPALDAGHIVILDRYFYSTIAYQGARAGLEPCILDTQMRYEFPVPDVVYLIDVEPEIGLLRVSDSRGDTPNEFEKLDSLRQVRSAFLELNGCDNEICLIDGSPSADAVYHEIAHHLVDGVLKSKRCTKPYGCDIFYCSYRASGECEWPATRAKVLSA